MGRHSRWKLGKAEINSLQNSRSQEVEPGLHIYCMNFNAWLLNKEIPDSDRIAMLIQSVGQDGIPENELRSGIELPKQLVDQLLAALVQSRIVRVIQKDGVRWYFGW